MQQAIFVIVTFYAVLMTGLAVLVALEPPRRETSATAPALTLVEGGSPPTPKEPSQPEQELAA
jgi:hypothetical protein